jgi:NTE family protein
LVLGAGGVLGGAWLCGGLAAIVDETGWEPREAEFVVGTSAGAMMAALVGAGVPPWLMVAHSGGEALDGFTDARGRPVGEADRSAGSVFRLHRGFPRLGPGSLPLALSGETLRQRLAGWLPAGLISTEPLEETVRRAVPEGWAAHPNLWIVACDFASGERVVFGRQGAPKVDLARAVAASCAIPGFYRPVEIGGRRYVDGGLHSTSNLDLLAGLGLDLVICLNPMSSLAQVSGRLPHEMLAASIRRLAGARLGREAKAVREGGTRLLLIQPGAGDLRLMGTNLMSRRRRHRVIELARRTVAEQVREAGLKRLLAAAEAV